MNRISLGLLFGIGCLPYCFSAETLLSQKEWNQWLNKTHHAAKSMSYSGTYVHSHEGHLESFKLFHRGGDSFMERRESLDGPPREFIRTPQELSCYLPNGQKLPPHAGRGIGKLFPHWFSEHPIDFSNFYRIKRLNGERVAGLETEHFSIEPKDGLRYGQRIWLEKQSGLLLKAQRVNQQQEVLEQFAFTAIQVGTAPESKWLKTHYHQKLPLSKPSDVQETPAQGWSVRPIPEGFQLVRAIRRALPNEPQPVTQLVYSDGLASVSIFISATSRPLSETPRRHHLSHLLTRKIGPWYATILGEVPAMTIQAFSTHLTYQDKK